MSIDGQKLNEAANVGAGIFNAIMYAMTQAIEDKKQRENENSMRSSLVVSFCNDMYHAFANQPTSMRACIVTVSTLTMESSNLAYLGNTEIGGWGYSIYVGYQGSWIKNNGDRGFENWCVVGNNHQQDNIIYID
jgi:hypothetical protein